MRFSISYITAFTGSNVVEFISIKLVSSVTSISLPSCVYNMPLFTCGSTPYANPSFTILGGTKLASSILI